MYEGGYGSKLIFDHTVWDHNGAISASGAAAMISGRAEMNQPTAGLRLEILDSLWWANSGFLCSFRLVNVWPLTLIHDNVHWIDNDAIAGHTLFPQW